MKWVAVIAIALVLSAPVLAQQVVVNSEDWRDVYSGLQFAAATGHQAHFIVDPTQGAQVVQLLQEGDVLLVNGREQIMPGLRALLVSRGHEVEELQSRNPITTNHDLALRAPTRNLVVINDAYGFGAVSVATYARMRNSSVLFASPAAQNVVEEKEPDELLLYGHIPAPILETLERFEPVSINNQDRFEDNFELVKRFVSMAPRDALLLTNGEFIEGQLISDNFPVLFTGRQNVPEEVIRFISDNGFRIAVLVGNSLAPNANFIKERTGISVFIKFAQGRNEQQFALDLFPIPVPNPLVTVAQAEHDPTQNTLMVTYQNPGDIATYFSGAFSGPEGTVEDPQPVFIEARTHKTVRYDMGPPQGPVRYTILYGAYPNSLDLMLQGEVEPLSVTVDDRSEVQLREAWYDLGDEAIKVLVESTGPVDAYVLVEASEVRVGSERLRLASEVTRIRAGSQGVLSMPLELTERDISRNREIFLEGFYGERELSLVKSVRATLPFEARSGSLPLWWLAVVALVAVVLGWLVTRKKR